MKIDKSLLDKYRDFLFPGLVVLLVVFSVIGILKPRVDSLLRMRQDTAKRKEELNRLSQKVAILEGYDQNELKKRSEEMLQVLPAEKNGPLVLATVRSLISEYNLELAGLDVTVGEISTEAAQPKARKEVLPSLGIQLSASGSLDDLNNFLNAIESTAPIMRIIQLSISREGEMVDTKMQLLSYYLTTPETIGKPDREVIPLTSEEESAYQKLSQYQIPTIGTTLPFVTSGKENPFVF